MKDAKQVGEEATGRKLVKFAKDAGYEITLDEMNVACENTLKSL